MVSLTLPQEGATGWDVPLNNALEALNNGKVEQPAVDSSIAAHSYASDPHGDRANAASKYLLLTDPSVTNARTPLAHASSHAAGGSDPVSPGSIGALAAANNLSDVASPASARSSLGLGGAAVLNVGTASGTVAAGNDSRLTGALQSGGAAGGDLSGTLPNPAVARLNGTAVAASPAAGQVLTATSSTSAIWQTPAAATTTTAGLVIIDSSSTDMRGHGTPDAGSTGLVADAGHVHPAPFWVPADNGLLAATYDPAGAGTVTSQSAASVAGHITLTKIPIRQQITWSNIWFGLAGADAGSSLANCYIGVYDSNGNLKGVTADISSSLNTNPVGKSVALSSSFVATPGYYYIAMLLNGTWTTNSFTFKAAGSGISVNSGLAAPNLRYSNMLSGQTVLPSTLSLSGQTTTLISGGWGSQWYGVS